MPTISTSDALNRVFLSITEHYAQGNEVSVVTRTRVGADADLGIAGTAEETLTPIEFEPTFTSIKIKAVKESDGSLRYSDQVMSMARSQLIESIALSDPAPEWQVNGERYLTIDVHGTPLTWEFTIRRKLTEEPSA